MTFENLSRPQLIKRATRAVVAAYALTAIHHVYGGLVDQAANRLLVPFIMLPPLLIMLWSLYVYRRTGRGAALSWFSIVAIVFFVVLLGLVHGLYAHAYKDLLFLVNGPRELYYSLNPSEHYPPDDVFFEITGVLDMVTAYFVALYTGRLIRDRQQQARTLWA